MRKSVSVAFFSLMSTLLIFGTVIMGGSELVLFSNYFAQERYDVLDEVVNVAQRTASHLVQEAALPEGEELEALNTKLELIGESAEVYLFFTDCDGNVVLASDPDDLAGNVVEASVLEKSAKAKENYHIFGTLDGVLTEKSYISVHEMRSESGECTGYLFLCSSGDRLVEFRNEFFSNFFLSACLMLLVASVLTKVMMHKLTDPIQKVTDAAQRFEGEVADLARTFNKMADNIQSNDNSRGQFMGNIAHELRTPMTTIKGFIDGILDGTIPPDMQNHYLQLVSEETGRLARLIQNMLDLSKLESGEYQVNARMFNIWETLTGVALSAEQRINDGMRKSWSTPTPTSSIRWPTICWTTPSSSPRQAAPSASGWRGWARRWKSPSGTPARASAPRRCPTSSSASTKKTSPGVSTPGAQVSA